MEFTAFNLFFLVVASPFLAAIVAPLLVRWFQSRAAWVLALVPLWIFLHFLGYIEEVSSDRTRIIGIEWVPALGVNFSFFIDGLSTLFAILISGIGALIIVYSGGYLRGHPQLGRFLSFMFLFMGSMLGLVVANNIVTLFVFWELTSISSFLLIGFNHTAEKSRRAALQALVVTGGGGLVMLAGLLVLAQVTQEYEMSSILQNGEILKESGLHTIILLLLLGGAFTKSAQIPFHFWLANAMEAPTPVSAYLHSATMVKAGVYLLMRINPLFEDTMAWMVILPIFGLLTLLTGSLQALRQSDMKLMLAYTTIASLGLLVLLIGCADDKAIEGAVLYLFAHALFKGSLFMVVGTIDHSTGTRIDTELGGLRGAMPVTFVVACLAALSMGGIPPLFGFIAKEILYEGLWSVLVASIYPVLFTVVCNAIMLAIAARIALKPFLGKRIHTQKPAHEGSVSLLLGPATLAVLGLLTAFTTSSVGDMFIQPAVSSIKGHVTVVDLHLLPTYIGAPLFLSLVTIGMGYLFYSRLVGIRVAINTVKWKNWGPDKGFDQFISHLIGFAAKVTNFLQFGSMKGYMTITILIAVGTMITTMTVFGEWPEFPKIPEFAFHEWAIFAVALIGLATVLTAANGMVAIVSLGIQGFAVAIIFMLFGAPDLSFTQFMVETLSVVILALAMTRLDLAPREYRSRRQKTVDASIAVVGGSILCLVLMATTQVPFNSELPDFFEEFSRTIAHGRNIVNVILVDYRGLDTLGEIAVVMVAGLAVLALVRIATPKDKAHNGNGTGEMGGNSLGGGKK